MVVHAFIHLVLLTVYGTKTTLILVPVAYLKFTIPLYHFWKIIIEIYRSKKQRGKEIDTPQEGDLIGEVLISSERGKMGKINNNDLSLQFLRLGCMRQS